MYSHHPGEISKCIFDIMWYQKYQLPEVTSYQVPVFEFWNLIKSFIKNCRLEIFLHKSCFPLWLNPTGIYLFTRGNVQNLFKLNKGDTRTTLMTPPWRLEQIWTNFSFCCCISIVDFELLNAGWEIVPNQNNQFMI